MVLESFRQMRSVLKELPRIEILAHRTPEHIGEIRRVTKVEETSRVIDGNPEHCVSKRNRGKGSDTWLGCPSDTKYDGAVCTVLNRRDDSKTQPVFMSFRIMEEK